MNTTRAAASARTLRATPGGPLLVLFFAVVAGIALGSGLYLRGFQTQARRKAHGDLQAIADMKVRQIAACRAERYSDVRFFSQATFVARDVAAFLAAPKSQAAQRETLHWLNLLKGGDRYAQVALFDTNLTERLAVADWDRPPDPQVRAKLAEALRTCTVVMGDLERSAPDSPPHLDIVAPVFSPPARGEPATSNAPVQALLLMRLEPGQFLYPLIQTWPTPSPSAETLLVRREGEEVVFLHELRHRAGAALSLRLPLTQTNVSAVRGVLGMVGVLDGPDYRGVPVVAVVRPVPGTSWLLLAKVDRAELYAPLRRQALAVGSVAAALALAVLLGTALLWRQRDAALLRQQLDIERERTALAQRLAQIMDNANDIILLADEDGRILEANRRAVDTYGWPLEELRSLTLSSLQAEVTEPPPAGQKVRAEEAGRGVFETVHRRKDGTTFPAEVSARLVDMGNERVNLAIVRDITWRKEIETSLRSSEQKYHTLFEAANDAILLMRQDRFLDCNARAAAMFGCAREDLIQATPWQFSPPAQPDGRPSPEKAAEMIHRALAEGPQFFEWEHCRRDGTRFAAEVSLNRMELGSEVVLLAIVRDVTARKQAETALRAKTEELDHYFTNSLDLLCIADTDGVFRRLNPEWERTLGYPLCEMEGRQFLDFVHPEDVVATLEVMRQLASGQPVANFTNRYRHRDGSYRWIEWRSYPEKNRIYAVARDVTARKQAEEALRMHGADLDRLLEISKVLAGTLDLQAVLQAATDGVTQLAGLQTAAVYLCEGDELRLWAATPPLDPQLPDSLRRARPADHPHIRRALTTHQPLLLPDAAAADLTDAERAIVEARDLRTLLFLPMVAGEQPVGALIVGTIRVPGQIPEPQIDLCRTLANLAALAVVNARLYASLHRHAAELEREVGERKRVEAALRQSRQQLEALTHRLQAAREEEARRIARELHDELGQMLTGLKMDLRRMERDLEETAPAKAGPVLERVLAASELADMAIRTVQRISSELRPGLLDKLGLAAALRHEARQFQQRTGIPCRLTVPEPEPQMPQEVATACYRVCQEALTNVARHAAASQVQIELRAEGAEEQGSPQGIARGRGWWVLEVRDNGRGIPPEKLSDPHSLGLLGMEERARALGGEVRIAPMPGGGTIVRLRIPRIESTRIGEP